MCRTAVNMLLCWIWLIVMVAMRWMYCSGCHCHRSICQTAVNMLLCWGMVHCGGGVIESSASPTQPNVFQCSATHAYANGSWAFRTTKPTGLPSHCGVAGGRGQGLVCVVSAKASCPQAPAHPKAGAKWLPDGGQGWRGGPFPAPTPSPWRACSHQQGSPGGLGRGALEGKGPQRRPQKRLDKRLEEVAKAVGGGYCRLQMPLKMALAVTGTVAGHRLGALEGGRGGGSHPSNASLGLGGGGGWGVETTPTR